MAAESRGVAKMCDRSQVQRRLYAYVNICTYVYTYIYMHTYMYVSIYINELQRWVEELKKGATKVKSRDDSP